MATSDARQLPAAPAARPGQASQAYDVQLLFPVLLLVGVGIVMVYSASSALAVKKFGSEYFFLKKQAVFAAAGVVAMVACRHLPYGWYRPMAYPILFVAVLCLTAIHLSGWGVSAGGSTRWLRLGDFTFQPSEFAKFALVTYLAYSLEKKRAQVKDFSIGFLPHFLMLALLSVLVFLQPDFGTIIIFGAITWTLLFIGGVRIRYLVATLLLLLPIAYHFMMSAEYRMKRLMTFLDPWQHPASEGYQIIHSIMAFGTGGIKGVGIGNGYQKLFYLPEPHTDFIFSVIGEELGLLGVLIIIVMYGLILWRGIHIARRAPDAFGLLMAAGLTTAIALQVCVNMGVALGLLPTKGLTLPFLSYGGTSLLVNMAAMGILMNIGASTAK